MDVLEPLHPELVDALSRRTAYPNDPSTLDAVEHIQTHLSHVFLTHDRVYKLRKAVGFDFVDFGSLEERQQDCYNEVRLNRRLAQDVYLGAAEVQRGSTGFQVGPYMEPGCCPGMASHAEIVTVMRRLPAERDALSLLRAGQLSAAQLRDVAMQLARFHLRNRLPASISSGERARQMTNTIRENLQSLNASVRSGDEDAVRSLEWRTREFEQQHAYLFTRRLEEGRGVDGHGDLHLQHIWFDVDGIPRVIDCLEFSNPLREVDAACDLAFLTMDLRYRGVGHLAERFLATYSEEVDDYDLFGVLRYFESYRATVRAKVANLAARDGSIEPAQREAATESCSRHLELANRLLEEPRRGDLIVTSGSVGTGKTTVARQLEECVSGIRISSDRLRKHLLIGSPRAPAGEAWNEGIYSPESRQRVYEALRERASEVLRSGRTVILDATFSTRAERDRLWSWARREGVRPWLMHTTGQRDVIAGRLRERQLANEDASDAGPELLEASRASYEAPSEWPEALRIQIDTTAPEWPARIREFEKRIEAAHFG